MRIKTSDFETCKAIKEAFDQGTPFEFMGRQWLGTALQIEPRSIDLGPEFTVDAHILQEVKSAPAAWNGPEDGLPPVGLEVEVEHQGKWIKCEVIAHFENENAPVVVFTFSPYSDKPKVRDCAYYFRHAFRPTRTAEQLAAEERSKACDQMYGVILSLPENRSNNRSDICEALYDAGYRKVEQP